jgi:hypothetical protein
MILAALLFATTFLTVDDVEVRAGEHGSWRRMAFEDVPPANGVVTIRADVDLSRLERRPGTPLGILFGGLASHELWWDGERIGGSGVVARTKEGEIAGALEAHYHLPDRLAGPGVHRLLVRTSAFHRGFEPKHGYWNIVIADYDRLASQRTRAAHLATIALSGILLTAVFAFAMYWLARRDRSFLLLGTLCLAAAALLIAEAWRPLFGYTYDWHIVRLRCIVACSWLVGVQLVALVVTRFPHRLGRPVLLATAIAATAAPFFPHGYDPKSLSIFYLCCAAALGWTIFAAMRRMHGSALALTGVGATTLALLFDPWGWVDNVVYFALLFLFVCLLCSHALEVRREQDERARLELEMVRRQLQPHFLMNTLTALSEWIEQEPRNAVKMIEALSEELRTLRELSDRSLVPLDDELRLCRSHIANMSLRNDADYRLEVDADPSRLVPPAVFHTLVENATTHGSAGVMRLSQREVGGRMRYVFEAPIGPQASGAWGSSPEAAHPGGLVPDASPGVGTRYIEARLREAWGDAWTFRQGRSGAIWRAEIEVPA